MNKKQTIKAAKIMLAWAEDGAELDIFLGSGDKVTTDKYDINISWNWEKQEYRIKQKPPLEEALSEVELVRDFAEEQRILTPIRPNIDNTINLIKQAMEEREIQPKAN